VDGSVCSCQKYLHEVEGKCPKVRGMDGESYCVSNRCQRSSGTSSPTPQWKPPVPTVKTLKPTPAPSQPTSSPTVGPPPVNCGQSKITDVVCNAIDKAKAPPNTKCTDCEAAECCIEQTCAIGLASWCDSQDTGTDFDCQTEDPCQVLAKPEGTHFPVAGEVKCLICDLTECCSNKTCAVFTAPCPTGQIPRVSSDPDGFGCTTCDVSECCKREVFTCTKANFHMNCSVGSRWEEENECQTSNCTAAECCVLETQSCNDAFPQTEQCPTGMRHKNASLEDVLCHTCDSADCCVKADVIPGPSQAPSSPGDSKAPSVAAVSHAPTTSSGKAVAEPDSASGNGGTIAAVVIIILVLLGAGAAFFLWRRSHMQNKQQYVNLNSDEAAYAAAPASHTLN